MRSKTQTNVQLVKRMMEQSSQGALMQAFIIEAIHQYSQQILDDKAVWPQGSFVSQEAWQTCAKEVIASITERNI